MKIKLSKSQWEKIGKTAGWTKNAGGWGRLSEELSDILEAKVLMNKTRKPQEIISIIRADTNLTQLLQQEEVEDQDLLELIGDTLSIFG